MESGTRAPGLTLTHGLTPNRCFLFLAPDTVADERTNLQFHSYTDNNMTINYAINNYSRTGPFIMGVEGRNPGVKGWGVRLGD